MTAHVIDFKKKLQFGKIAQGHTFLCVVMVSSIDCHRSTDWPENTDCYSTGAALCRKTAVHLGQCRLLHSKQSDSNQAGISSGQSHSYYT